VEARNPEALASRCERDSRAEKAPHKRRRMRRKGILREVRND